MNQPLQSNPLINSLLKSIILILIIAGFSNEAFGQAPANTCNAAAVTVAIGSCATTPITVGGTGNTGGNPACGSAGSTERREGYYTFTVPAGPNLNITATATSSTATSDLVIQIFSGCTAGAPTGLLGCANNVQIPSVQTEALSLNLAPGTYLVRVVNYTTSATAAMSLSAFCIYTTPANDGCAGVVNLTPSANCVATAGFSLGGTPTAVANCVANQANDDVWYSFIATQSAHTVTVAGLGTYNPVIQVFSGGCGVTSVGCVNVTGAGGTENDILTGLTTGVTYYVRVYDAGTGIPPALVVGANFNICVTSPPLNDDCTGAAANPGLFNLTSSTGSCTTLAGTVNGATASVQSGCGTGTPSNDVWYTFTTPAGVTSQTINVSSVTGAFNPVIELFSGTCPTLTSLGCFNTGAAGSAESDQWVNLLTASTQYFVRVYDFTGATATANSGFTICAVSPPANDDPCTAISLTPATSCVTGAGGSASNGDIAGATNTGIAVNGACSGTGAEDDVWYSFTTSSVAGQPYTITVTPTGGSPTLDAVFEVFTFTGTCASLTSQGCVNGTGAGGTERVTISPTTFGPYAYNTTYYVRVYDAGSSAPTTTGFTICVTLPPVNDGCLVQTIVNGASTVTYGPTVVTPGCPGTVVNGTVAAATQIVSANCGGVADDDVWYSFIATQSTQNITVTTTGTFDAVIEAFGTACGTNSLGCTNAVTGAGTETAYLSGLTTGTTYWYRVYDVGTGYPTPSTFTTSVSNPPANDDYCNATNVLPVSICNNLPGSVNCATPTALPVACTGTASSDVWYVFTCNSINQTVSVTGIGAFNPAFQLFTGTCAGGLTAVTGTCTNATGAGLTESYTFPGTASVGTLYYIRIYDFGGASAGSFTYCVTFPLNDQCAQAVTVSCGNTYTGNTSGANTTGDPAGLCFAGTAPGVGGVWYVFVGNGSNLSASVCGSTANTRVAVFTSNTNACGGTYTCVAGTNAACGTNNTAFNIGTVVGTNYYILVYNTGAQGAYSLAISCGTPPANDQCSGAIPVSCGSVVNGTTINATMTNDPTAFCGTSITVAGVWYVFTGNGNTVQADLCTNSAYDNKMNVFSTPVGSPCPPVSSLTCVGGNDDACGLSARVTFPTSVGQLYYIFVAGFAGNVGNFTLTITCLTPPSNDLCANAIQVNCDPLTGGNTYSGSTVLASIDQQPTIISDPECFGPNVSFFPNSFNWITPGVWYWYMGDGNNITLSLCGGITNYDTQISVLFPLVDASGGNPALLPSLDCTTGNLACVTGNDDNPIACNGSGQGLHSQVTFSSAPCTPYYILVHGFSGAQGNYTLTVTSSPSCISALTTNTSTCPLPIELLSLTGHAVGEKNIVEWITASETNNNYFNIDRSEDGINFTSIARVEGAGNSIFRKSYFTYDNKPVNGWTYYRLKQTDFNGQFKYSTIIAVENSLNNKIVTLDNVHPNPTTNDVNFDFYSSLTGSLHIQVLDYLGRVFLDEVQSIPNGSTIITAKMEGLAKGIYSLKVSFDQTGFVSVTKVVKN